VCLLAFVARFLIGSVCQARTGQDVMSPGNKALASLAGSGKPNNNTVTPPRDSNIIKPDVDQLRKIIVFLNALEDKGALSEDEVYKLERLVSVNKDQVGT
jgi:hypothetical protein